MARHQITPEERPIEQSVPLPDDWRAKSRWAIWAMLAKIPPSDYDATAKAFEQDAVGRVSADWNMEWRTWCRRELIERSMPTVGLFG